MINRDIDPLLEIFHVLCVLLILSFKDGQIWQVSIGTLTLINVKQAQPVRVLVKLHQPLKIESHVETFLHILKY